MCPLTIVFKVIAISMTNELLVRVTYLFKSLVVLAKPETLFAQLDYLLAEFYDLLIKILIVVLLDKRRDFFCMLDDIHGGHAFRIVAN